MLPAAQFLLMSVIALRKVTSFVVFVLTVVARSQLSVTDITMMRVRRLNSQVALI